MPDFYTLFAKIRSLPKGRIAEVEDFVDFLVLRRVNRAPKPIPAPEVGFHRLNEGNRKTAAQPTV